MGEDNSKVVKNRFTSPIKHTNLIVTKDAQLDGSEQKVCVLLLKNFSMASFTGALDVLVTSNLMTKTPIFQMTTVSLDGQPVTSDLGIEVNVDKALEQADGADCDIFLICGGLRTPLVESPVIRKVVARCMKREIWMGSLWNGLYYMLETGAFDEHECTVHPDTKEYIKESYPDTRFSKLSHVIDGKFFSSVGPSGSMKVMLELIEKIFGKDIKKGVNGILLADNNRSINSAFSNGVTFLPSKLETIIELMENNLEEPLSIGEFSEYTSLSRRQVERLFARYLNTSPSRYYLELRLNRGRQLLLKTNYSISEIALACGFLNNTHFSHSFKTMFGSSPTAVRLEGRE